MIELIDIWYLKYNLRKTIYMKPFFKIISILTISLGLLIVTELKAQNTNSSSWSKKLDRQKSFIENKGQFVIPNSFGNMSDVLFAVDNGGTKIYFTKKGITYTFLETIKKQKDEREMERERREEFKDAKSHERFEKEEHQLKTKTDQVTMLWQNSNPNTTIEASGLTSDYHSYNFKQPSGELKNECYVKGYKKITYKNIYPNIDIEYVFAEKDGLKYALTLHPGADPSLVKMVYDNPISLNSNGEIEISTKFGDIIDHAPLSFYENNTSSLITSKFIKNRKTVSFQLDNYDNTQTVVIDPWTQTPAFVSNWDCVWECEKDGAGNVYIIGGVTPLQLIKYNSAGVLQWTYNTAYDTTSWLGGFAVDNIGNSYVTNGTTPGIIKVNTTGALQWSVGGGSLVEYWEIAFNCDQTKLIVGGTDNLRGAIFDINTANGAVLTTKIIAYGSAFSFPPSIQEVRAITACGNGRYYFLTLDSIGYINQNFTLCGANTSIFKTTSTHGFSYKCENFRKNNTGIMAIRADLNFVYTHNGTTLFKRSLANASIIASVAIPGGAATTSLGQKVVSCSGIDIDASGNIYVGSTNAVTKFSSALVQLGTVAVPFNVYDVHVSTAGDVIACGSTGNSGSASRTGYIQSISSLTAGNTLSLTCCDANICLPPNQCLTAPAFNLVAATAGGTWSGTGITNTSLGTFNPSIAGAGSFVITYSLACGVGTTTVNVSACGTVTLCINSGSITASGGTGPYTWASTTTTLDCSGCFGGACSFLCAGVTVPAWTATGTTVAAPASTVFPIKVKDVSSGVTYTFNTLASIPPCSVSACPTLTLSVSSQTNVNCFGASTGTAAITTSGGAGPYTYTWSPGALSGASQTGLSAGVYTIAIKDINLCPGTGLVTITQPTAAVSAVISATSTTGCGVSTGGATVTASGGTPAYIYSWVPSGGTTAGVSNLAAGNNTVTVTDSKGCTTTAIALITTAGGPTVTVNSPTLCSGASAVITASGATTYSWSSGLSSTSGTTVSANPLVTTIYTVTGTTSGCSSNAIFTVSVNGTPTITPNNYTTCPGGSATLTASGATSYTWSPAGTLSSTSGSVVIATPSISTNYTVVGGNGTCTSSATSSVTVGSSISLTSTPATICVGTNTTLTVSGASSYTWSPSATLSSANGATVTATPTITTTYTITGLTGACTGSTTVLVTVNSSPTVTVNSPTLCSGASATVITASGATTYSWSAGLSSTSGTTVTANPSTTTIYTVTGTTGGCSSNATFTVSINGTPTITPNNYTTCPGGSATLTATGATSYTWSPAATLSSTSGSVVIATPASSTNYTVVGANGTCTSSATSSVTIGTSLSITSNSASICIGSNTVLTVSGATSYTWSPTATLSSTNGATVTATPTITTTYTITGLSGSCTGTTTVLVTVNSSPTVAVNSPTICSGASAVLTATGATTYNWSAGLSSTIGTTVTANPTTTTIYTVIGTTAGCSSTQTLTVYVNATPTITTSNYTTCPGGSATLTANGATNYTWSPAATLSSSTGSVVIATPSSNTNYIVIGANGTCTNIASSMVTINSGLTISANSAVICTGSNTVLTVSGATNYTWSPAATLNSANGATVTATPTITTTYTITGLSGSCTGSTTALVVVNNTPTITVNSPTLCSGNSTILTASGAASYSWSTGATTQTISVVPNSTSSYTVIGTTGGCSSSSVSTIVVTTTPTLTVSPDVTIIKGASTTLTVFGNGATYTWSPSATLSCATCTNPIASPIITTQYCVSSKNGACSTSSCIVVTVEPACYSNANYQTPDAFTPNGDGVNDEFCLKGWAECTTTFYVAVYDRWGEKVFEASDPNFCWDGKYQGTALNTAVFVFYIKADIVNVGTITKKGNITLLK